MKKLLTAMLTLMLITMVMLIPISEVQASSNSKKIIGWENVVPKSDEGNFWSILMRDGSSEQVRKLAEHYALINELDEREIAFYDVYSDGVIDAKDIVALQRLSLETFILDGVEYKYDLRDPEDVSEGDLFQIQQNYGTKNPKIIEAYDYTKDGKITDTDFALVYSYLNSGMKNFPKTLQGESLKVCEINKLISALRNDGYTNDRFTLGFVEDIHDVPDEVYILFAGSAYRKFSNGKDIGITSVDTGKMIIFKEGLQIERTPEDLFPMAEGKYYDMDTLKSLYSGFCVAAE